MPGALLQLAAYGVQDIYLTGNPQMTYFVSVYKRHTNFAIECYEQLFTGEADFGKKFYCKVERIGDLIGQIYLKLKLPSIESSEEGVYRSWVNSIGHAIILRTEIEIAGMVIDKHYGQWLEIWSELTMPAEKRVGYDAMIGKHENFDATTQGGELELEVPLQFWFCRNKGLMLPLIALQNSEVRINFEFRRFNDLWISSLEGDEITEEVSVTSSSLMIDYVFLEDEERRFFAQNPHFYLIEQLQLHSESVRAGVSDNVIALDQFNHPTKELVWVVQNSDILTKVSHGGNEWFNFGSEPWTSSEDSKDNMKSAVLQINGNDRFQRRDARYFRLIEPYKYHLRVPNNFIYVYSFGFCPEEHQPSGTCNLSRVDNLTLNVEILKGLNDPVICIYAPCYNIMSIAGGIVGVKYVD